MTAAGVSATECSVDPRPEQPKQQPNPWQAAKELCCSSEGEGETFCERPASPRPGMQPDDAARTSHSGRDMSEASRVQAYGERYPSSAFATGSLLDEDEEGSRPQPQPVVDGPPIESAMLPGNDSMQALLQILISVGQPAGHASAAPAMGPQPGTDNAQPRSTAPAGPVGQPSSSNNGAARPPAGLTASDPSSAQDIPMLASLDSNSLPDIPGLLQTLGSRSTPYGIGLVPPEVVSAQLAATPPMAPVSTEAASASAAPRMQHSGCSLDGAEPASGRGSRSPSRTASVGAAEPAAADAAATRGPQRPPALLVPPPPAAPPPVGPPPQIWAQGPGPMQPQPQQAPMAISPTAPAGLDPSNPLHRDLLAAVRGAAPAAGAVAGTCDPPPADMEDVQTQHAPSSASQLPAHQPSAGGISASGSGSAPGTAAPTPYGSGAARLSFTGNNDHLLSSSGNLACSSPNGGGAAANRQSSAPYGTYGTTDKRGSNSGYMEGALAAAGGGRISATGSASGTPPISPRGLAAGGAAVPVPPQPGPFGTVWVPSPTAQPQVQAHGWGAPLPPRAMAGGLAAAAAPCGGVDGRLGAGTAGSSPFSLAASEAVAAARRHSAGGGGGGGSGGNDGSGGGWDRRPSAGTGGGDISLSFADGALDGGRGQEHPRSSYSGGGFGSLSLNGGGGAGGISGGGGSLSGGADGPNSGRLSSLSGLGGLGGLTLGGGGSNSGGAGGGGPGSASNSQKRLRVPPPPRSRTPPPSVGGGGGDDGSDDDDEAAAAARKFRPEDLPPPVAVLVSGQGRQVDSEGKRVRITVHGIFHPDRYLTNQDCIFWNNQYVSRSRFEKEGGSTTAKWHCSIKTAGDNQALGAWLTARGLPVLKGGQRKSKRQRAAEASTPLQRGSGSGAAATAAAPRAPRASTGSLPLGPGAASGAGGTPFAMDPPPRFASVSGELGSSVGPGPGPASGPPSFTAPGPGAGPPCASGNSGSGPTNMQPWPQPPAHLQPLSSLSPHASTVTAAGSVPGSVPGSVTGSVPGSGSGSGSGSGPAPFAPAQAGSLGHLPTSNPNWQQQQERLLAAERALGLNGPSQGPSSGSLGPGSGSFPQTQSPRSALPPRAPGLPPRAPTSPGQPPWAASGRSGGPCFGAGSEPPVPVLSAPPAFQRHSYTGGMDSYGLGHISSAPPDLHAPHGQPHMGQPPHLHRYSHGNGLGGGGPGTGGSYPGYDAGSHGSSRAVSHPGNMGMRMGGGMGDDLGMGMRYGGMAQGGGGGGGGGGDGGAGLHEALAAALQGQGPMQHMGGMPPR